MKQKISKIFSSYGYSLKRTRNADVELFNSLCRYVDERGVSSDFDRTRFVEHCARHAENSSSQRMQDLLADFVCEGRAGLYCEFGATNGKSLSNTFFLEVERNWRGVLAEPGRNWHAQLAANRPDAHIDHRCVYASTGTGIEFYEAEIGEYSTTVSDFSRDVHGHHRNKNNKYIVETVSLNDLLVSYGFDSLDYLSVDTEGSEYIILKEFNFDKFRPKLITVEHNFTEDRGHLFNLIQSNGYQRIFEELSAFDDWYVRADVATRLFSRG